MKKLFYLVAAVGMLFTACEYDDTELNNRIDDLENRVVELEETIAALNQDIAGVRTLVDAMQNNVYVSKIVKGETGYDVYFTNGEKISIADGKAGEAGKDGVTVTVMQGEDGEYYWAVTKDGKTEFLLDNNGNKLPVKGEKGDTPTMRVVMEGETGYWEVSYDGGETWERVLLEDGTPVTTSGGAGGLFKEAYVDEDTNTAVFVFLNGETIEIALGSELYINFKGKAPESVVVEFGKTVELEMESAGVLKTVVTTPDEWKSSFNAETGIWSITAPTAAHASCADLGGEVAIIYFGDENQSSVITAKVSLGMTIEAEGVGETIEIPYTFSDELTVVPVENWITGSIAEGKVTLVVEQNMGAERTGTVKLVAADYEVVITIVQVNGVKLLPYGYRAGSEEVAFNVKLTDIPGLNAATADHIAVTNDYVIISSPGATPVVLNATTGEYVGTLNVGDLTVAAVTQDDANNIIISTFQDAVGFRVARMKSITDTPEVFIERASTEYGKDISVVGDVYGDARVTLMYSPWSSGTTGHLLYQVVGGVADGGYWSKIGQGDFAAELTDAKGTNLLNNNNGDVIYRDMGAGAPYFMTGYSSNRFIWAEGGVTKAYQVTTNSNCGAVCIDVEQFNNAYYLATACDTYFTWALPDASIYMADVTTIDNFKAGVLRIPTGDYGWNAASMGGNTDCALKVSADGVYMYVYVLHPNASLGCIRVDCLDK